MERTVRDEAPTLSGVDEAWLREWADFGLAELAAYLRLQAAFSDYCERRGPVAEPA